MTQTVTVPMITSNEEAMRNIGSFSDAMALLHESGVTVLDYSTEFGDGFSLVEKKTLIGVPFVVLGMRLADGDHGDKFAIVQGVTEPGTKFVITDGGSGICKQVTNALARDIHTGVYVKNGLTVSEYTYVDDNGKETPAKTYYFAS